MGHLSCMFWIRWRRQLTCAICRCFSGLTTICEKFAKEYHVIFNEKKRFCMRIGGNDTAPRRFVTMNGEPILWKRRIRCLGNFITHNLSDLNDITYKKGVFFSSFKLTDLTQDFPLFQVAPKVTNYKPTAVPSIGDRPGIYIGNMSIMAFYEYYKDWGIKTLQLVWYSVAIPNPLKLGNQLIY